MKLNIENIYSFLGKLDYKLSKNANSRAQYQVENIVNKLLKISQSKFNKTVDVGGGFDGRYRKLLVNISKKYQNLEISNGNNVDLIGSVYKIPLKNYYADLVTSFMVLEHLSEPKVAFNEMNRILKKNGLLALTTVQYWHTHNYPSDYFRYTKFGLEYLCNQTGFKIIEIWSHGGPLLVIFHAIELNLPRGLRVLFSISFYKIANFFDYLFFKHNDTRKNFDSVGWSLIAKKV